jgi:hypothetical protein
VTDDPTARRHVRTSHLLVGAWTAGNGVLAGIMLGFGAEPISIALWAFNLVLLSTFGVALLIAEHTGRGIGTAVRLPVRATAAALTAIGLTIAGLALPYNWLWLAVGCYPLVAAAILVRGERVPRGMRPTPTVLDGMPPAPTDDPLHPPAVFDGSGPGPTEPVPATHPAHAPPRPRPRRSPAAMAAVAVAAVPGVLRALFGSRRDDDR